MSGGFIAGLFGIKKGPMGLVGLFGGQNLSLIWMLYANSQGPVRSTASIAFFLIFITTALAGIAFVVGLGIRSAGLGMQMGYKIGVKISDKCEL